MRSIGALALAVLLTTAGRAEAASCREYLPAAARAVKPRVEAVRMVEREAADRIKGLDTRPYPYLATQARAVADAIGEAHALAAEDELEKCPVAIAHVRRVCATAARALAFAIEEQATGGASAISRQTYARAMGICEDLSGVSPLRTVFRLPE